MKATDLLIRNFLTIDNAHLRLDNRGLNVVQGLNTTDTSASSNGAGKSSLVDALCWCLYGVTAKGLKADDVVNEARKKDTEVSTRLEVGETIYQVTRYRKHHDYKNAVHIRTVDAVTGVAVSDLTRGTDSETQKVIEKVIGSSRDVFLAAVYMSQEKQVDIPSLGDRALKALIEEAAGLERIERAYSEASKRVSEGKGDVLVTRGEYEKQRTKFETIAAMAKAVVAQRDAWDAARAKRIEDCDAKVESLKGELETAHTHKDSCTHAVTRDRDLAKIEELRGKVNDVAGQQKAAEAAEKTYLTERNKLVNTAATANALIATARAVAARVDAEVTKLKEGGMDCPACGSPMSEAHRDEHIQRLTAERSGASEAAKKALAAVDKSLVEKLKAEATEARAGVPDISVLVMEIRKRTADLAEDDATLARLVAETRNAQALYDSAVEEARLVRAEKNPHDTSDMKVKLTSVKSDAIASKVAFAEAERQLAVAEATAKVFGPSGVRAQILDTVTPFLNERTSAYLSALSDGNIVACWTTLSKAASGDLKEKFSIDVKNLAGGSSYQAMSGGEKRKVRIATALALQDLVASRATNPIDLWIGDEIDDALDANALERLMSILETKARTKGTAIVISHNDLSDWADQVTTVTKYADKLSTITGSLQA